MNWDDLIEEEQQEYEWFLTHACGMYGVEEELPVCPVVRYQMASYRVPRQAPLFLPEAIYGEPRAASAPKDVWYLAVNPGQGFDEVSEMYCPHNERNPPMGLAEYGQHHLAWFREGEDARYADSPTGGAMAVELLRAGIAHNRVKVRPGHDGFNRGVLSSLTMLNTVHCKSPSWKCVPCNDQFVRDNLWAANGCGVRTFAVVRRWRPRVVVCMGGAVRDWLARQAELNQELPFSRRQADGGWASVRPAAIRNCDLSDADIVHLRFNEQHGTCFLLGYHPSSRGKWNRAHVELLVQRIRTCLLA